jgi:acyl-coenzyme A thioesterase PaaI-like protein
VLIAAVGGVPAAPLSGAAASDSVLDERRGADCNHNFFAHAREEAVLARAEPASAAAVLPQNDVARTSGDESAAVIAAGDPVARAPVTLRARGPPHD